MQRARFARACATVGELGALSRQHHAASLDLAQANVESLVGPEPPWFGYFFVMDDEEKSRNPGAPMPRGPFTPDPAWRGRSYQERFALTGQRFLSEQHYDAVCYLVSSPDDPGPREPSEALDWRHFSAAIEARIEYLARLGYP